MMTFIFIYVVMILITAIVLGRRIIKSGELDDFDFIYIVLSIFWPIVWFVLLFSGKNERRKANQE